MSETDMLPPIEPDGFASGTLSGGGAGPAGNDTCDVWPTAGPAKGLRVRLPIAIAALAVVALVGAAAGAALKKPSSATAVQAGAVGGNRANGAAGTGGFLGGGVVGTVTKIEGNTLTVTERDGSTVTVVVPSGTTIDKTVSGSLADLKAGESIAVRGTTADGKTTAEAITLNPANGGTFGPGGFGAPPAQGGTATNGGTTN